MGDKQVEIKGEILKNIDIIVLNLKEGKDVTIKNFKDNIKIQSTKTRNIN